MSIQIQTTQTNPIAPPTQSPTPIGLSLLLLATALITYSITRPRPSKTQKAPPVLHWLSQGKDLESAKKFSEAITLYDQALTHHPTDYRLWHERGLALAKLQKFEAAIASYDRAHQLNPTQRDLSHERGDALLQLHRYEEAIASLNTYLRYDPNSPHVLADKGFALHKLDRHEEALQTLNQVLQTGQRDPNSIQYAHYYQIETLRQLGQLSAALQSSQSAITQHPNDSLKEQHAKLRQQISKNS